MVRQYSQCCRIYKGEVNAGSNTKILFTHRHSSLAFYVSLLLPFHVGKLHEFGWASWSSTPFHNRRICRATQSMNIDSILLLLQVCWVLLLNTKRCKPSRVTSFSEVSLQPCHQPINIRSLKHTLSCFFFNWRPVDIYHLHDRLENCLHFFEEIQPLAQKYKQERL